MITDAQVLILRQRLAEGCTQAAAALEAQMSVRSARKWQKGPLPSECRKPRHWRTRNDPLANVWECEIMPMVRETTTKRSARELLQVLAQRHPEDVNYGQLRTLQRRLQALRPKSDSLPRANEREVPLLDRH